MKGKLVQENKASVTEHSPFTSEIRKHMFQKKIHFRKRYISEKDMFQKKICSKKRTEVKRIQFLERSRKQ